MRKTINILVIIILLSISKLKGQNFEGMNKSELRKHLNIFLNQIDSFKKENFKLSGILKINDSFYNNQIRVKDKENIELREFNLNILREIENSKTIIKNQAFNIDSLNKILNQSAESFDLFGLCNSESQGFNFKYIYENGNGCNPPIFQPIGWSKDGKFAYREVFCDGGCGCCSEKLTVYDIKFNAEIPVNIYNRDDNGNILYPTNNLQQQIYSLIKTYKILATGPGNYIKYEPSKELFEDKSFELIDKKGFYELWIKSKSGFLKKIKNGKLDKGDESYPIPPESIGIAGYFINPWNKNELAIALIKKGWGFENETSYSVIMVGFVLN
jgi:hypothetical protein